MDLAGPLTAMGGRNGSERGYRIGVEEAVNDPATGVRRLTPIECERLQGLPDGWTDPYGGAADARRYAALGDAVTANVAEWIGRRILAHA